MKSDSMNFSKVRALIVDSDQFAVEILCQILEGFGLPEALSVDSFEAAKELLPDGKFDLLICEAMLKDGAGADLVRWVRSQASPRVRYMPVVMLTAHTQLGYVESGRDSGVNVVVKKPVSPTVLFDRLVWSANSPRPFIETETYVGPDRRFKFMGLPECGGRRKTDLVGELGEATEPNLSQDEIDGFMKPARMMVLE
jgi:CheY-like chemotaxis protein